MADAVLSEAVRKRRVADALNGQDDDSEEEDTPPAEQSTEADTAALAEEEAIDQGEVPPAAAEKAQALGYRFVPVTPQATTGAAPAAPAFMGEEGADVSPALTTARLYSTPPEEGDQQYVIDQDTGQKIPRAQLATSEDLAAQPPPKGAVQFPQEVVTGQAPVEPAPDTLPQVERGELVSVPPGTAPRAVAIPTAPVMKPAEPAAPSTAFMGEEGVAVTPTAPAVKRAETIPAPPKVQPAQPVTTNPDGSDLPQRVQAVGNNDPAAFIVHHTSGRGTVDGVVSTLKERGLGVQYVMDRDGNIFQTGGPGAQNILKGWGKGEGLSNQNIVGMEIIAKDDKDVTPQQAQSFARFIAARYPNTPLYGHGEVNPGHKEADEGQTAKAAALAYRTSGQVAETPGAPQAQPVTKQANGLYQNEKPNEFLSGKATTFATPEDIASGQDNGVGAPRLGKLDTTSVAGVAIPEEALRAKYGNNYAAWRKARVDVVDPQTGKRLRVPIVDLGPRGDLEAITDMTPTLSSYFGGDKNLMVKLVDNAGPDVTKNPQLWADEQAAIRQGFDSSAVQPGVQKIVPKLGYTFKPVIPSAEGAARQQADAFNQQNFRASIAQLPESDSGNVIGLYKRLDKPVSIGSDPVTGQDRNVPASMRQEVQANLKPQIIAAIREKFPELKTDDEAWAKAQSDVGALDVGREWVTKALGYAQQFTNVMQKGVAGSDQLHVNQFLDAALPGASDADKHAYLTKLYAMPVDQRIQEVTSHLPQPQAGMPSTDPQQIVSALDRLSDPNFQKQQVTDLAKAQAEMKRNVTSDPRLVGTGMEKVVDATAQMPAFVAAFSNPVMIPVALAQVSDQVKETFRAQHPEWNEKELQDKSAYATLVQFYGMEAANRILMSGGGAVLAAVEGRGQRAIAQAIYGTGSRAAIGAGTQAATNIIGGQPVGQGVGEAALAGGIQGLVGGVVHGAREIGTRPEGIRPAPQDEAVQPPLVTSEKPQLTKRPLSAIDVLGHEPPQTIAPEQADDVLKVVAHNVFPDLNDYEAKQVADRMAALTARNLETDRFRYELERFLPQGVPYSFGSTTRLMQAYGAFQDGPTVYTALELQRAQDAFNAVRNPQVRAPGALKLPIMWREVEARIPEEQAPSAPVEGGTTFTTAKGSTYVLHDDGTTTRNKAYHPEHGIADQGPQPRSEQTFFITPEDAQKLAEFQTRGGPKTVVAPLGDGRFGLKYVEGPDTGKFERRTVVTGRTAPDVGLMPVEMWQGGSKVHFGNEITEVNRPPTISVTQEDVARRAYELYDERTKNGQPGTALDDWTQAQKELSQATSPPPVTQGESEPWVSAIANRFTAERAARGEVGEVIPGEGYSKEELLARGLQMGPEEINQHVSDLMNDRGGNSVLQGAAVRAEEARLSQRSNAASRASEADPANQQLRVDADNAFKDLTDFHNGPVAKFKKDWSDQGRTLQGEIPVDLSTFNGMREKFLRDVGKPPPPKMEPVLRKVAKKVSDAAAADKQALQNLGSEIERQTARRRLPTDEEVRTRIMERMKVDPCRT
jgi:N-acetylmuramoyl-L-alanine amidase